MSPDNELNIIKPVPSSQSSGLHTENIAVSSPVNQHKEKKQPRQEKGKQHPSAQQPEKTPDGANENKLGNHVIDYRA